MGLIDNVNVNVGGNGSVIDTLSTYVTKVLKPNIINGKNILSQGMMPIDTGANAKYVIKYNYELSEDITIPENCILEFDGGSISGTYTLTGNNTGIEAGFVKIFNTNVTLGGSWNVDEAYTEWFDGDLQKTVDSFPVISLIRQKIYELDESLVLNAGNVIHGNNAYLRSNIQSGAAVVLGNNNSIKDISIALVGRYNIDRTVVLLDVSQKKNTKNENRFNLYFCSFVNETFVLENITLANPPAGYNSNYADAALKIVGNGQEEDDYYGLWGNIISNFRIYGNFKYGIYIDCPNSNIKNWITCSNFINGTIADAQIGIYIDKSGTDEQIPPHGLNFEGIHYQTLGNTIREQIEVGGDYSRFALLKHCSNITFSHCTIVDWTVYQNKTVLESAAPFLINPNKATQISITDCVLSTTFSRFFDSLEPLNTDIYQCPSIKYSNYAMGNNFSMHDYIDVPASTTSEESTALKKKILLLTPGRYSVKQNISVVLEALGNPNIQSGDFIIAISGSGTNVKVIELFSSNFANLENGKSRYLITTYNSARNTTQDPTLRWEKGKSYIDYDFGANRPSLTAENSGYVFLDATLRRVTYWLNNTYVDANGFSCNKIRGTLAEAESVKNSLALVRDKGYLYYAEDLFKWISLKMVQNGSTVIRTWIELDGAKAGVARSGATADRPVGSSIYVGFMYFDTSLSPARPIYASAISGDTVTWVDATGTPV